MIPSTPNSDSAKGSIKLKQSASASPADFIFSQGSSGASRVENIVSRNIADRLLERYWDSVHPVARILHRPSFAQRYETLWEAVEDGYQENITPSLAAIVFSVLLSAVVSMSEEQVRDLCQESREELIHKLKHGTENSLGRAQLLHCSKVETLQAFVAYLVSLTLAVMGCHYFV